MATFPQEGGIGALSKVAGLRDEILRQRSASPALCMQDFAPARAQVICVTSGKGGTGKTMVATNLSALLSRLGLRTTLIDADFGLANDHLLLGLDPPSDISSVIRGEKKIEEICVKGPFGLTLVPGGSGKAELSLLSGEELNLLAQEFLRLEETADVVVVDLGAGLGPCVLKFLSASHDIVLVTDGEATARSDALATIGALADILGAATVHIVVNRARSREHAVISFQNVWAKVNRRWRGRIKLFFSGWVPDNWYVKSSVILGKPVVAAHPFSLPTRCLRTMAEKIHKHHLVWRSRQVGRWGAQSAFARMAGFSGRAADGPSFDSRPVF